MSEVATYIVVNGELIDANLQPPQSELQSAFKKSGKSIVIDMTVAKEVARGMIRTAREPLFIENDAAYTRAQQRNENAAAFVAKGEMLRGAPADTRIDDAVNAEELLTVVETIISEMKA